MATLLTLASFFVTPEMALPIMLLGGILLMFGAKSLAGILFVLGLLVAFSPLIEAVVSEVLGVMPEWVSLTILVVFVLWMFRWMSEIILGREGAGTLIGNLATMAVVAIFRIPFRMVGSILRMIFRR